MDGRPSGLAKSGYDSTMAWGGTGNGAWKDPYPGTRGRIEKGGPDVEGKGACIE
jgi:hypothetical protein